jgi:membrane protein required for colicin V production
MSLGWVDWAFLALLLLSMVIGVVRGLLYEVMSLLGWVVAYVAAQAFGVAAAPALPVGTPGSALNLAAGFLLVFIAVLLCWWALSWLLSRLIKASPLQALDRLLGMLFGLLRGGLVALAIGSVVALTPLDRAPAWRDSHSAAACSAVLAGLKPLLPEPIIRHLRADRLPVSPSA